MKNSPTERNKEEHRLGTMGRWDPPEADWAAEYDWTRYRGPDAFPVPGGWVFKDPEGGGWWEYYGDSGVGHHSRDSILDELKDDESVEEPYEKFGNLGGDLAFLQTETANPDEVSLRDYENEKIEWSLEIAGEKVFRRVDPDRGDLMAAVAEALHAYHTGELDDRRDEIVPTSGQKPADIREQERLEQREEENESLDEFATDGGREREGLYQKFEVLEDGEPVEEFCFVLKPESDKAAIEALQTYAEETDDRKLAADLMDRIHRIMANSHSQFFEEGSE